MKKSLFDFASEEKSEQQSQTFTQENEQTKSVIDKYSQMPREDLEKELLKEVSKMKQEGTFDFGKLKDSSKTLAPFLSKEQMDNLEQMLWKIK